MKTSIAYETITQKIIESMEAGDVPWRKPWTSSLPKNLFTGKNYRGVNAWLLSMIPTQAAAFATFNQIKAKGGSVLKGSKSTPIYFFTKWTKEDDEGNEKSIPLIRSYNVFTIEQMEGIDLGDLITPSEDFEQNVNAQNLIDAFFEAEKATLSFDHHGNDRAYYSPTHDRVSVPAKASFKSANDYYSTVFHEIGHSTGHEKRLKRAGLAQNRPHGRGEVYSFEELVAELTASYLCAICGLDNEMETEQRAAYIKSWVKVLKDDKTMIWKASSQAQKAVDYILEKAGIQINEEEV